MQNLEGCYIRNILIETEHIKILNLIGHQKNANSGHQPRVGEDVEEQEYTADGKGNWYNCFGKLFDSIY